MISTMQSYCQGLDIVCESHTNAWHVGSTDYVVASATIIITVTGGVHVDCILISNTSPQEKAKGIEVKHTQNRQPIKKAPSMY